MKAICERKLYTNIEVGPHRNSNGKFVIILLILSFKCEEHHKYSTDFLKRQNMLSVVSDFFGKLLLVMGRSTHGRPAGGLRGAVIPQAVRAVILFRHM